MRKRCAESYVRHHALNVQHEDGPFAPSIDRRCLAVVGGWNNGALMQGLRSATVATINQSQSDILLLQDLVLSPTQPLHVCSLVLPTCGVFVVKTVAATRLGAVCITCLPYPRFQVSRPACAYVGMYLAHAPAIGQAATITVLSRLVR
jgi:hypothetical protein